MFCALILMLFSLQLQAQIPTPTQPQVDDDDDVVRINTNLVQLDAVVTDKNGNPVADLRLDDFEVFQDGKLKDITNFSFVDTSIKQQRSDVPQRWVAMFPFLRRVDVQNQPVAYTQVVGIPKLKSGKVFVL